MYKNGSDNGCSTKGTASPDNSVENNSDMPQMDHIRLVDIGSRIDTIQEKIDIAYGNLCMVLPQINMEIYRTFEKAIETLDSISSEDSPGKIDSTLTYIRRLLETVRTSIICVLQHNSKINETLESLNNDIESIHHHRDTQHAGDQGMAVRYHRDSAKSGLLEMISSGRSS